ncbi:MAG: glycosyltransferase family A protein [Candidatus Thorarchaeota archaeon]|jgi:glycosyltransferase involved in cell wall biosynthesis
MIDIALLSCNRARITELTIREIKSRTTTPHRLIVLDNGSIDNSPTILLQLHSQSLIDKLILSDDNSGVHWGHNRLLQEVTSSPYYICADNDLIPCSPTSEGDWLSRLITLAESNPSYAAIACRPHIMIGDNRRLFDNSPPIKERGHIGAHLRIMHTAAVRETGGWSQQKRPSRNNEERWICGKLKQLGHKVGYSRDIRCIHLFGEESLDEDPWGYPLGLEHGHRDVWPPVNRFSWDKQYIDWKTCQ